MWATAPQGFGSAAQTHLALGIVWPHPPTSISWGQQAGWSSKAWLVPKAQNLGHPRQDNTMLPTAFPFCTFYRVGA
jgi:hypothetical protein